MTKRITKTETVREYENEKLIKETINETIEEEDTYPVTIPTVTWTGTGTTPPTSTTITSWDGYPATKTDTINAVLKDKIVTDVTLNGGNQKIFTAPYEKPLKVTLESNQKPITVTLETKKNDASFEELITKCKETMERYGKSNA